MARKVKDKELDSREARSKLKPRPKPYLRTIERELCIGYRRLKGKSGTWLARFYCGQQRYESESLGIADDTSDFDGVRILSYWQAVDMARARMTERAKAERGITGPLTVAGVMQRYLQYVEDKGKPTSDTKYRVDSAIVPVLGDVEAAKLTTDQIHDWHVALSKRARKHDANISSDEWKRRRRASANRTLTILRAALTRAWRDGKIPSRDAWQRVQPFGGVQAARERHLSIAECQRLLNMCPPDFKRLVQVALLTGCRYGELGRLRVADFHKDSSTLHIRKSKSGKERHLMLTEEAVALFTELCAGRPGNELILLKVDGSAWGKSHQVPPMTRACERARITPPISFHCLRHTWASLSIMNGMPLMAAAQALGHKDVRMVTQHYGHLSKDHVTEAIRAHSPRFGFTPDTKLATVGR